MVLAGLIGLATPCTDSGQFGERPVEQRAQILDIDQRIERRKIDRVVETAGLELTRGWDDFDGRFVAQYTRVGLARLPSPSPAVRRVPHLSGSRTRRRHLA